MSIWMILFVILLIVWICGFTLFHAASALIHLLLLFAVMSLILHFVLGVGQFRGFSPGISFLGNRNKETR